MTNEGRKMQRLLRRACHATNLAREQDLSLKPSLMERCYDGVLANGLAFHEAQPALTKAGRRDGSVITSCCA
jgi:transposase